MIKQRDNTIEHLKRELEHAKSIISKCKNNSMEEIAKEPTGDDSNCKKNTSLESVEKTSKTGFKLDFSKANICGNVDTNKELNSDRSTKTTNLMSSFSTNKLDKRNLTNISNNISTLFRQSNKISQRLNDSNGK
jgi:hypothetical protein